jgi:hypothetical protein
MGDENTAADFVFSWGRINSEFEMRNSEFIFVDRLSRFQLPRGSTRIKEDPRLSEKVFLEGDWGNHSLASKEWFPQKNTY